MGKLSKIIEEKRQKLRLSQQDLAEMSGVSLRTVTGIENGEANPSLDTLDKIAYTLGLEVALTERVKHD